MKKYIKLISILLVLIISVLLLWFCFGNDTKKHIADKEDDFYIKVGDTELDKEYVGYLFYIAKENMIKEAGYILGENGNSTEADVRNFWKTTEIDGKSAVEMARDLAADNAVLQTVQYLKAVDEGIKLTAEDEKAVQDTIEANINSSGGEDIFRDILKERGSDEASYRQILIENIFVQKLYDKYDSEGKISVSDAELTAYAEKHSEIPPENILNSAKTEKFNSMADEWEKDYGVSINDKKMLEFNVE